jgi:hypothetical protein
LRRPAADALGWATDAEQLFVALRWLGRQVRFVLYPGDRRAFRARGAR